MVAELSLPVLYLHTNIGNSLEDNSMKKCELWSTPSQMQLYLRAIEAATRPPCFSLVMLGKLRILGNVTTRQQ